MAKLFSDSGKNQLINNFITKFKQVHREKPEVIYNVDEDFIKERIGLGIDIGLIDLGRSLGDGSTSPVDGMSLGNRTSQKGFAKYLQERLKGLDATAANTKLVKYLKYRDKRSGKKTGFKWTASVGGKGF